MDARFARPQQSVHRRPVRVADVAAASTCNGWTSRQTTATVQLGESGLSLAFGQEESRGFIRLNATAGRCARGYPRSEASQR